MLLDDDDASPARVGVVAARKATRRPEGSVTATLDGLTLSALLAAAGDDGLGLGCVDVEALGWRGADVVVVIRD